MRTTNENDGASLHGTAVGCQALDSDGRHVGELWVASVRDGVREMMQQYGYVDLQVGRDERGSALVVSGKI